MRSVPILDSFILFIGVSYHQNPKSKFRHTVLLVNYYPIIPVLSKGLTKSGIQRKVNQQMNANLKQGYSVAIITLENIKSYPKTMQAQAQC